jgi:hypothetical protein
MTRHGRRSVLLILALVNASASAQSDKFPLPPATTTPEPTETAPAAPPSAPAAATGRVVVRGLQGTPDGPPIADAPVRLQLVHRGAVVQSRDGRSDERGVAVFEELPVDIGVLPVVQIEYAGVSYQQPGQMMDARLAEQTVDVTCFEVTTEQPPWSVATRHVMLDRVPGGVRVAEIVVIENPAPRTWLGIAGPVAEGRPCTTQLPLPTGAAGVTLGGGFHDWCCTTLAAGRLFNHLPMMPATTELRFGYVVPAGADGRVELDLVAPAAVGNTMVVFPEDLEAESAQGLVFGGSSVSSTIRPARSSPGSRSGSCSPVCRAPQAGPRRPWLRRP